MLWNRNAVDGGGWVVDISLAYWKVGVGHEANAFVRFLHWDASLAEHWKNPVAGESLGKVEAVEVPTLIISLNCLLHV